MCVHKDVSQLSGAAQDFACRSVVASRSCVHYRAVEDFVRQAGAAPEPREPMDVEDLLAVGQEGGCGPCPYFLTREWAKARHARGLGPQSWRPDTPRTQTAEIVFMPYNYLLDSNLRRVLTDVDWCVRTCSPLVGACAGRLSVARARPARV